MLSDYEREKFSSIALELSSDKAFADSVANQGINPNLGKAFLILIASIFTGFGLLIFGVAGNAVVAGVLGFVVLLVGTVGARHFLLSGVGVEGLASWR